MRAVTKSQSAVLESAVVFPCQGADLVGILHSAPGARDSMIFVTGGGQYRVGSHRLYVQLARSLAAAGVSVLRFDHQGRGDSSGTFRGFRHIHQDLVAARDALRCNQPTLRRIFIMGLCDGASAAVLSCMELSGIAGMVLINPWVYSSELEAKTRISSYYLARLKSMNFWRKVFTGRSNLAGSLRSVGGYLREIFLTRGTPIDDLMTPDYVESMLSNLKRFSHPVLVILCGQDLVAQQFQHLITHDRRWQMTMQAKTFDIEHFKLADHTFSTKEHQMLLGRLILTWLRTGEGAT